MPKHVCRGRLREPDFLDDHVLVLDPLRFAIVSMIEADCGHCRRKILRRQFDRDLAEMLAEGRGLRTVLDPRSTDRCEFVAFEDWTAEFDDAIRRAPRAVRPFAIARRASTRSDRLH